MSRVAVKGAPSPSKKGSASTTDSEAPRDIKGNGAHYGNRLGDILLESGIINEKQLEAALKKKENERGFLGKALVDLGFIDQNVLVSFLVKQCKIPHISLLDYEVQEDLLELVPEETCIEYNLVPIDKLGKILTIAMVDPLDIEALEHIRSLCPDLRIKPILCDWDHLTAMFDRLFNKGTIAASPMLAAGASASLRPAQSTGKTGAPKEQDQEKEEALDAAVAVLVERAATAPSDRPPARRPKDLPGVAVPGTPPPISPQQFAASIREALKDFTSGPAASKEELTAILKQGVESAMQDATRSLVEEVRAQVPQPAADASPPSAEEVAALVEKGLRRTLEESLTPLVETVHDAVAASSQGPSHDVLVQAVRDGLQGAMGEWMTEVSSQLARNAGVESAALKQTIQETLGPALDALQAVQTPPEAPPQGPSLEEIAETMRTSVRGVLDDSMESVVVQLSQKNALDGDALRETIQNALAPALSQIATQLEDVKTDAQNPRAEELASAIQASLREALTESVDTFSSAAAQSAAVNGEALKQAIQDVLAPFLESVHEKYADLKAPSAEELAVALQSSLREALNESMDALASRIAQNGAMNDAAFKETLQDAFAPVLEGMRAQHGDMKIPSAEELAAALQAGLRGALSESMDAVRDVFAQSHALAGPTLKEALQEALNPLLAEVRNRQEMPEAVAQGPTPGELAEALHAGLGQALSESIASLGTRLSQTNLVDGAMLKQAMQEALDPLLKSMQEAANRALVPILPSPEEIAQAIRDSIRDAIQGPLEALSAHLTQSTDGGRAALDTLYKAIATHTEEASRAAQAAQQILESMREMFDAARVAQESHAAQENRLAELAQAAIDAARAAEAAVQASMALPPPPVQSPAADMETQLRERVREFPARRARDRRRIEAAFTELSETESDALAALEGQLSGAHADERVREAFESERPLAKYQFDGYVTDETNAFAVAMCRAVAENPGGEYNPFYLYGECGMGKTHLVNAIGNAACENNPDLRVAYVSSSNFAQRISEARKTGEMEQLRDQFCQHDMLILDDVQFLAGRQEAQEEFFHIFNAMVESGRQIVIAGDKAPEKLAALDRSLASRFAGGIVAPVRPPEWKTRMCILHHLVEESGNDVPEEVLSVVATRVPNDIRKMTGSLRKVIAFAGLVGQDITGDLASEILNHLGITDAA